MSSTRSGSDSTPRAPADPGARVRDIIERFNAGGAEAVVEDATPDVQAIPFPEWLDDPLYEGHDGFRRLIAERI